jgi:ubiquinone biosynthesis protein
MERWMADRVGPTAVLRELGTHAPEIMEQLPRLPELVARAGHALKRLDQIGREQRHISQRLDAFVTEHQRTQRGRRWVGVLLLITGASLLWAPVTAALATSEPLPITVGLLAAVLGSLLLARS